MLSRERQQPPDQRSGTLGGAARGVERADDALVGLGLALQPPQREIDVAQDGGEQIVEIVRDAAGQPADRLHLLRLAQRQLGDLATRRLLTQLRMRGRLAPRPPQRHDAEAEHRQRCRHAEDQMLRQVSQPHAGDRGLVDAGHHVDSVPGQLAIDIHSLDAVERRHRDVEAAPIRRTLDRLHEAAARRQAHHLRRDVRIARQHRAILAHQGGDRGRRQLRVIVDEIIRRDRDRGHTGEAAVFVQPLAAEREEPRLALRIDRAGANDFADVDSLHRIVAMRAKIRAVGKIETRHRIHRAGHQRMTVTIDDPQIRELRQRIGQRLQASMIRALGGADALIVDVDQHLVEVTRRQVEGLEHLERVFVDAGQRPIQPVARIRHVIAVGDHRGDRENHQRQDDRRRQQPAQRALGAPCLRNLVGRSCCEKTWELHARCFVNTATLRASAGELNESRLGGKTRELSSRWADKVPVPADATRREATDADYA